MKSLLVGTHSRPSLPRSGSHGVSVAKRQAPDDALLVCGKRAAGPDDGRHRDLECGPYVCPGPSSLHKTHGTKPQEQESLLTPLCVVAF